MFGTYSYGLYVVHVPLFLWLAHRGWTTAAIAARLGTSPWVAYPIQLAGAVAVALAVAAASWHLFEAPILNGRRPRPTPSAPGREEFASTRRPIPCTPVPSAPDAPADGDAMATVPHVPGSAR
jgi:peptidoglycan/LPS O-acetylase OafA/YrhL